MNPHLLLSRNTFRCLPGARSRVRTDLQHFSLLKIKYCKQSWCVWPWISHFNRVRVFTAVELFQLQLLLPFSDLRCSQGHEYNPLAGIAVNITVMYYYTTECEKLHFKRDHTTCTCITKQLNLWCTYGCYYYSIRLSPMNSLYSLMSILSH